MKKNAMIIFIVTLLGVLVFMPMYSSNAAESIDVWLEKPKDVTNKTDGVKIKGYIDGLEEGVKYIIRIQVYEDGGSAYSPPFFKSFSVVE